MFRIVTHYMHEDMRSSSRYEFYSEASDYFYAMQEEGNTYGDILSIRMYDVTSNDLVREWMKE